MAQITLLSCYECFWYLVSMAITVVFMYLISHNNHWKETFQGLCHTLFEMNTWSQSLPSHQKTKYKYTRGFLFSGESYTYFTKNVCILFLIFLAYNEASIFMKFKHVPQFVFIYFILIHYCNKAEFFTFFCLSSSLMSLIKNYVA